jgi:hypothetical protein
MPLVSGVDDNLVAVAGVGGGHLRDELGQPADVAEHVEHPIGRCRYVLGVLVFHGARNRDRER